MYTKQSNISAGPPCGGHQAGEAKVRVFQSFQSVFATGLLSLLALVLPGVVDLSLFVRYPPPKVPPGPKKQPVTTPEPGSTIFRLLRKLVKKTV